jgi:poly(beta-D-mannuronate) lyase
MFSLRFCSLSLALLHFSSSIPAAEFLVGTPDELATTQKHIQPGDILVLKNGLWPDADLLFEARGTSQAPIILKAQTPGQVVISGKSRLRIAGEHLIVDGLYFFEAWHDDDLVSFRKDSKSLARNCRLTECAILNCNRPTEHRETRWISLYGTKNRVDHCRIEGKTTPGPTLVVWLNNQPNEHQIDHNDFGPRPFLGKNGGETIRIGDSQTSLQNSRTTVEANCFTQCDGEAEIISNKSCENLYRGNVFRRCSGALTLRHGNRCRVERNFFLGEKARGTGGVRLTGEDHQIINNYFGDLVGDDMRAPLSIMNGQPHAPLNGYAPVKNALIAFNTFVNCKLPLVVGLKFSSSNKEIPPQDCTIANNLFIGQGDLIFLQLAQQLQAKNFTWIGNLADQRANMPPLRDGFNAVIPHFQENRDGIWRPQGSSPVLHAAVGKFPEITEDLFGNSRPARPNVGCDEGGESVAPLQRRDVGPQWATNP